MRFEHFLFKYIDISLPPTIYCERKEEIIMHINLLSTLTCVGIIIFTIFSSIFICVQIYKSRLSCHSFNNGIVNKTNEELLSNLTNRDSGEEKADAFIGLIINDYVLIHKQTNEGCKYVDKNQTLRFREFLDPNTIKVLNEIGK